MVTYTKYTRPKNIYKIKPGGKGVYYWQYEERMLILNKASKARFII